jgi:hypothetical protein
MDGWMDGWMDDDDRVSINKVLFPENRRFRVSPRTGLAPLVKLPSFGEPDRVSKFQDFPRMILKVVLGSSF